MKKLKHSKYKNTGILFEMLVRKLTSETLTSDKSVTIDIIKKYFGRNTELSKELQLYNALIKEQHKTEARALDFMRTVKTTHKKLNQAALNRQKYNLVKEISENFIFENMAKIHINNYKELASIYMLFEYSETDNPKQLMQCKNVLLEHVLPKTKIVEQVDEKPESSLDFTKILSKGSTGLEVESLQKALKGGLVVDGNFGALTEKRLKAITGQTSISLTDYNKIIRSKT
jgi:hypothetical protein